VARGGCGVAGLGGGGKQSEASEHEKTNGLGEGGRRVDRSTFYNPTECKRNASGAPTNAILIEIGFCAEKSSYLERTK
jgi:hypothetical protein